MRPAIAMRGLPLTGPIQLRTGADGRALALTMFREIGDLDGDDWECCFLTGRDGKPFNNLVLKYLDALAAANREAVCGFAAVLTDYCASGADVSETEMYEQIEREFH